MNIEDYLILINGEDKTEEICSFNDKGDTIEITFKGGRPYPYTRRNVEIYQNQQLIQHGEAIVSVDGHRIRGIRQMQIFENHTRIIYQAPNVLFNNSNIQFKFSSTAGEKQFGDLPENLLREYSIFVPLFQPYGEMCNVLSKLQKHIAESYSDKLRIYKRLKEPSEKLMFGLICEVLNLERFSNYDVEQHSSLNKVFPKESLNKLDCSLATYASYEETHVDFLIFNKLTGTPVLGVEVDGGFHRLDDPNRQENDQKKDAIFSAYGLPLKRFRTDGSGERETLEDALKEALAV
jgi:very-short-patch-repair endonuclease